jgi:hypothetical protein
MGHPLAMAIMKSNYEQLFKYWRSNGLVVTKGKSESDIRIFESRYEVVLPTDLRTYFLQTDGMNRTYLHNYQDAQGFSFYPLSSVTTLFQSSSKLTGIHYDNYDLKSLFIFADYLDLSWAYAIRLYMKPSRDNEVMLVGDMSLIKVADSFTEFIELYLMDSSRLYPGKTQI